jgi:hypothetical protein
MSKHNSIQNLRKTFTFPFLLCLLTFFTGNELKSQENYFQQTVNYTISVQLDDVNHSIRAEEDIEYINRSDSTLHFIWMHLWPNAYKERSSALCKQLLQQNNSSLYFSKPEERGWIDSLDFKINGQKAEWNYHPEHKDICKIKLSTPLQPGERLLLSTPFYVKIPSARFSRLGHIKQAYFMTQWYPKPAVFDKTGWHPMPYLNQGEFYSEFGTFDVSITLPKNYVLAATGDRLFAEEEERFLNDLDEKSRELLEKNEKDSLKNTIPPSDTAHKTVRFHQSRVHDFAWFADKRYLALHDQVQLPTSGRVVDTWVFFTPENSKYWKKAIGYVNDAVLFYSKKLGDYPYNHATAVDGTIMAGGGMEYPNITVIGTTNDDLMLDVTITHEVGHNWFYGILASNERDHPFMDEGLNSLYEMLYVREKYADKTLAELAGLGPNFPLLGLNKKPYWKEKELLYFMSMKAHLDQPIQLPSEAFTGFNYGSIVYSKTALVFDYLRNYLGQERFDKAMQAYYQQYRFKHPQPDDLFASLSASCNTDLRAFEHYFINTNTKFDYKIKRIQRDESGAYSLLVKNKTGSAVPFVTQAYKNNKAVALVWSNGFEGKQRIAFPPLDADVFKLDAEGILPDLQRRNNVIHSKGVFKRRRDVHFNFITSFEDEEKINLNVLPIAGVNFYNGFMLGAALHNFSVYRKPFEFYVAPMYAFNSKTLSGFAEMAFNFFPKQHFSSISAGLKAKSFAYDYFNPDNYNSTFGTDLKPIYTTYYKLKPFVDFDFKKKQATSKLNHNLIVSSTVLFTDSLFYTSSPTGPAVGNRISYMNGLQYVLNHTRLLHPYTFEAGVLQSGTLVKSYAKWTQKITFSSRSVAEVRVFAGAFLSGSTEAKSYYAFRAGGYTGYQDMLFDHNFIARNERNGLGFSQFAEEDGALKVWTPLGQSSTWLGSVNIKSPKLFKLPLKVYADVVFTDKQFLNTEAFLWDAGLNLSVLNSLIEVYFPLVYSKDIRDALELNQVEGAQRIRFTLNIHNFSPGKVLQNILKE